MMETALVHKRSLQRCRRPFRVALASLAILALSGVAQGIDAQGRVRASDSDVTRRIQSITPRSGPPGTVVTVSSALMPHITPVRVGIGATRTGFESLAELLTSLDGEFSISVTVPEWVQWDRSHRFILFDFYFNPIALSDAFYVTDAQGRIHREGAITDEGDGCLAMRDLDGQLFTLIGDVTEWKVGDRVVVEGMILESSECVQQPTIRITRDATPAGR